MPITTFQWNVKFKEYSEIQQLSKYSQPHEICQQKSQVIIQVIIMNPLQTKHHCNPHIITFCTNGLKGFNLTLTETEIHPMTYGQGQGYCF